MLNKSSFVDTEKYGYVIFVLLLCYKVVYTFIFGLFHEKRQYLHNYISLVQTHRHTINTLWDIYVHSDVNKVYSVLEIL